MKSQVTALSVYGLNDLIEGVTPTYTGWTVDPTDGANITDNDISTRCTTGNKVTTGAWQYAEIEWDLGGFYNILCTGMGRCITDAGNPAIYIAIYDGARWIWGDSQSFFATNQYRLWEMYGGTGSKVKLLLSVDAIATISPDIYGFHVWRQK